MDEKEIFYFSVAGKSNTGKTDLVQKIVKELKSKDYNVATLKHTKGDYSIDEEGKDTWKHRKAGSDLVIFSTSSETSFIYDKKLDVKEILETLSEIGEYDVLVIEGMKNADVPKVSTTSSDIESDIEFDGNIKEIVEWVEKNIELIEILNSLPKLDCGKCGFKNCRKMAESILKGENVIENCKKLNLELIDIKIDGEKLPISKFPSSLIQGGIIGMLKSLKGVKDINTVEISFDNKNQEKG